MYFKPTLGIVLFCCLSVHGQFGPQNVISKSVPLPRHTELADIDGDGDLDVVVCSSRDYKVSWYENDGNGSFGCQKTIVINGFAGGALDCSDIDMDGDIDIITAGENPQGVIWCENIGGGVFTDIHLITTDVLNVHDVYASDLDNDGDEDVLYGSFSDNVVAWHENLGNGDFGPQSIISVGIAFGPESIYTADFDNDNDQDVVVGCNSSSDIVYYENLGSGNFGAQQMLNATAYNVRDIYPFDVNSDGNLDILATCPGTEKIIWHENLGGGAFSSEIVITVYSEAYQGVRTIDVDGDGIEDVVATTIGGPISWFKRLSNGTFLPEQFLETNYGYTRDIDIGDIDGDGLMDIVIARYSQAQNVSWKKNLGAGNFSNPIVFSEGMEFAFSTYAADFDNDGDLDVLCSGGLVAWFENLGFGNFGCRQVIDSDLPAPKSVVAADLDNDGDMDVIGCALAGDKITWSENLGAGTFGPQQIVSTATDGPSSVHCRDLDNDGDLDILSASVNDNKIAWYENLGSGVFGPQQIVSSTLYGACHVHTEDMDNDGDYDIIGTGEDYGDVVGFENLGSGNFGPGQTIVGGLGDASSSYAADIDNDGDRDIIVACDSEDKVSLFENLGSWSFAPEVIISTSVNNPYYITGLDVHNDGDHDLIVGENSGDKVSFIENINNTGFLPPVSFSGVTNKNHHVYVADLDSDGDLDVLTASGDDDKIAWYENFDGSSSILCGSVFYDKNANNVFDTTDIGLQNIPVYIQPGTSTSFSQTNGNYNFPLDTGIYYIAAPSVSYWQLGTDSTSYTVLLNNSNPLADSLDFGYVPDSVVTDIIPDLTAGYPQCSSNINFWACFQNIGTSTPNGIIKVHLHDSLDFVSCDVAPDSVVGQIVYWHFDTLNYFSLECFNFLVALPSVAYIGGAMTSILTVFGMDSLGNTNFEYADTLVQNLICAYDPNDKTVDPEGIGDPGFIENNLEMEYLVRFQNTGTATATNIVVHDHLDPNLDWSTFNIISYSHPMTVWIEPDGQAVFEFANIMLPDSNSNEPASHGFVKYKILMDPNLLPGSQIFNQADIYFDFNPPIYTNTEVNTIIDCDVMEFSLGSESICLGESLMGSTTEGWYSDVVWSIDTFYTTNSYNLNWISDTIGTFNLNLSINNDFCSKDTVRPITVYPTHFLNTSIEICSGDSVQIGGYFQSSSGIYNENFQSIDGCDSIIEIELTINPSYWTVADINICQGDSILINGIYEKLPGLFYDSLQTVKGCDSTLALTVIAYSNYETLIHNDLCQGDSIYFGGAYLSTAGVYNDSLQSVYGCDSIVELNISILPSYYQNQNVSICQGDSILIFGSYESNIGVYIENSPTVNGCDSIQAITLDLIPIYQDVQIINICPGDSAVIFNNYESNPGTYYDSLQTIYGCDSVQIIQLMIHGIFEQNQSTSICQGDSLLVGGQYYSSAGLYYDSLQTIYGCDSVILVQVDLVSGQQLYQSTSICQGDSLLLGGSYQTFAGVYYDSLLTGVGCDSILITTLSIDPKPVVSVDLFAEDTVCSYTGLIPLPFGSPVGGAYLGIGVISGYFDPLVAGMGTHQIVYEFVDSNNCTNSDTCLISVFDCLGVNSDSPFNVSFYPNPNTGLFSIIRKTNGPEISVVVFDNKNSIVLEKDIAENILYEEFDISHLSSGTYYIQLRIENEIYFARIVKI